MSMQELTDDQLDGLFRKSAEEFDPPYDSAAWEAMKNELDDRDRAAFWKRLLPWALPVLLLLLTGGGWFAYQKVRPVATQSVSKQVVAVHDKPTLAGSPKRQQQDEIARPTDTKLAETTPVGNSPSSTSKEAQPVASEEATAEPVKSKNSAVEPTKPTAEDSKPVTKLSRITNLDATKNRVTTYRRETGRENVAPVSRTTPAHLDRLIATNRRRSGRISNHETSSGYRPNSKSSVLQKRDVAISSGPDYDSKSTNSFRKPIVRNYGETGQPSISTATTIDTPTSVGTEVIEPMPVSLPTLAELMIKPGKWAKLPGTVNREVTEPERTEPMAMPKAVSQRGFSIRVALSPDLSTIGLHNIQRPGTNIGLLAEYRLSPRWSFQTGVIRSTKVYYASASQYDGEALWANWMVKPVGANGQCNILDIPLNVRYDIALLPRLDNRMQPSRWFVSAGVTSYIMLKEKYVYDYVDPTNPHIYPNMREWSGSSGGYGFSQLNLSAGYERALGRRLSWQIEPFIKAPIKGVGWLNMNLLSTGAFLSLRYKL